METGIWLTGKNYILIKEGGKDINFTRNSPAVVEAKDCRTDGKRTRILYLIMMDSLEERYRIYGILVLVCIRCPPLPHFCSH